MPIVPRQTGYNAVPSRTLFTPTEEQLKEINTATTGGQQVPQVQAPSVVKMAAPSLIPAPIAAERAARMRNTPNQGGRIVVGKLGDPGSQEMTYSGSAYKSPQKAPTVSEGSDRAEWRQPFQTPVQPAPPPAPVPTIEAGKMFAQRNTQPSSQLFNPITPVTSAPFQVAPSAPRSLPNRVMGAPMGPVLPDKFKTPVENVSEQMDTATSALPPAWYSTDRSGAENQAAVKSAVRSGLKMAGGAVGRVAGGIAGRMNPSNYRGPIKAGDAAFTYDPNAKKPRNPFSSQGNSGPLGSGPVY